MLFIFYKVNRLFAQSSRHFDFVDSGMADCEWVVVANSFYRVYLLDVLSSCCAYFAALLLLVLAINPFALSSPLANKNDKPSSLTSIQQRRVSNFGFVAGIRCQVGKSILSKAQAEKAIANEVCLMILLFWTTEELSVF